MDLILNVCRLNVGRELVETVHRILVGRLFLCAGEAVGRRVSARRAPVDDSPGGLNKALGVVIGRNVAEVVNPGSVAELALVVALYPSNRSGGSVVNGGDRPTSL